MSHLVWNQPSREMDAINTAEIAVLFMAKKAWKKLPRETNVGTSSNLRRAEIGTFVYLFSYLVNNLVKEKGGLYVD